MLTPEYLATFSNGYLGMVDNLNEQIVRDIARRMVKAGKVTDTAKWQIKQAQESGKLLDDIVKEVGKFSGYSDKEILAMFKDAGIASIRNDGKPLLDAGVISEVNLSQSMQELLLANYLNVATTSEAKWALMGYGVTTLDEEFGAESESSKYINEASESSSVVSYKSVFPFTAHLIPDEEAINALYTVGRDHLTGEDAEFEYVRVELWNKKEADKYAARKFIVSAEIASMSGEKKQELSGNLNAVGDPVDGTFDIKAKKFEPTPASLPA